MKIKECLNLNKKKFNKIIMLNGFVIMLKNFHLKIITFDYYTISFGIRNVDNINNALKEAYRVLKTWW